MPPLRLGLAAIAALVSFSLYGKCARGWFLYGNHVNNSRIKLEEDIS